MKPVSGQCVKALAPVAPRAGAWIETKKLRKRLDEFSVAPRAGAWIETSSGISLKGSRTVAPRAGAWIETWY